MPPTLHAPGHAKKLEVHSEPWGVMCWLVEDRLIPGAGISVARMTANAGSTSPAHRQPNCSETIALLSGTVTCLVDGREGHHEAGDVVSVSAGSAHAPRNDTDQAAVAMLSYSAGARFYKAIESRELP